MLLTVPFVINKVISGLFFGSQLPDTLTLAVEQCLQQPDVCVIIIHPTLQIFKEAESNEISSMKNLRRTLQRVLTLEREVLHIPAESQ